MICRKYCEFSFIKTGGWTRRLLEVSFNPFIPPEKGLISIDSCLVTATFMMSLNPSNNMMNWDNYSCFTETEASLAEITEVYRIGVWGHITGHTHNNNSGCVGEHLPSLL